MKLAPLSARILLATSLLASIGRAQLTWDANALGAGQTNGGGAWLNADQWFDGVSNVTWSSGAGANFGGPFTAGGAVTLASPTEVAYLSFSQHTGTYTLGSSGQTITLNGDIVKTAASALVSIVSPITLGADQSWYNYSSGSLTTSTGSNLINLNGQQLTFDGSGAFNLGIINNATQAITGSGALIKNGSGRVNIGGINSGFTGTVAVNQGVLHVHNDAGALGAGNVELSGGVLSFYWGITYNRTLGTGNNQVNIPSGESGFAGSGTNGPTINLDSTVIWGALGEGSATGFFNPTKFILGDSGTGNAAATAFSSGINLNGASRTVVVPYGSSASGNISTISGAISNGSGTAGLSKEGGGRLFLSNNTSAWNGPTDIQAGTLDFGGINIANIGGGSGRNITVASGAGVRFNALSNSILNRIVETSDEISIETGTTSNNLDFSGSTGANLPNAFLSNWAGNGAKAEVSGSITPGSDGYKFGGKMSNGLLGIRSTLSGDNTLTIGMTGSTGIRVNIVGANTHTGETVINTGSKLTIGNNLALQNSPLNLGAAGGTFALATGTNGGRIAGETAASSPTFGGLIGSRNLHTAFTNSVGNNETNFAATSIIGFTLNVGDGETHTYSGAIGGFGSGAVGATGGAMTLTKTGLGTQILDGNASYTGETTVDEGSLIINGNHFIGGLITVNPNGTLGGSGIVGDVVVADEGTFAPGSSAGTFSVASLTLAPTSKLRFELGTPNMGAFPFDSDFVSVDNLLTLDGELHVTGLPGFGSAVEGDSWVLFQYVSGNLNNFGLTVASAPPGRTYYVDASSIDGQVLLVAGVIPEPSSFILFLAGSFFLIRKRIFHRCLLS